MGIIYAVGIGPGDSRLMTSQAAEILEQADVLCGYTSYVDLIRDRYPDKEFISTPMRGEEERCRAAIQACLEGKRVAVVCSGDAQVYGMAGLLFELAEGSDAEIEVIPGLTAALSGGALLGAPLGHDFAVISLSDLLTPAETIRKRLAFAAEADFVICLYNPRSKGRPDALSEACRIIMRCRDPETVCGFVRNIARDGQTSRILSLKQLRDEKLDMFTTVFIGSSNTKIVDGKMVTPRGYRIR